MTTEGRRLAGQVALVAGATRGAGRGIARALGEAGAMVYCTGRSSAGHPRGMDRPETIDQTVAMIEQAGGRAVAVRVDHTREEEVASLASRVRNDAGRLDVLVNSIWGADPQIDWGRRFWEVDLAAIHAFLDQTLISHVITSRHMAPLMVEVNRGLIVEVIDGHFAGYRGHILYDLVKSSLSRLSYGMAMELAQTGVTALSLSPGFLRSEAVLDHFAVREDNWRDARSRRIRSSRSPRVHTSSAAPWWPWQLTRASAGRQGSFTSPPTSRGNMGSRTSMAVSLTSHGCSIQKSRRSHRRFRWTTKDGFSCGPATARSTRIPLGVTSPPGSRRLSASKPWAVDSRDRWRDPRHNPIFWC